MKFNLESALTYIFGQKNFCKKMTVVCSFLLLYLFLGIIRSYFTSYMYFDGIEERVSLSLLNFTPKNLYSFVGFPVVAPFLIGFDICQLMCYGFEFHKLLASGIIILAMLVLAFPVGFFIFNAHNRILYKKENLIAVRNFSNCFKKGFFAILGCVINSVPALIVSILACKSVYIYFDKLSADTPDLVWFFTQLRSLAVYVIVGIIAFIMFLYLSAAIIPYILDLNFSSFFKFKRILKIISESPAGYFKYVGFSILFNIIFVCLVIVFDSVFNLVKELNPVTLSGISGFIYGEDLLLFILSLVLLIVSLPFIFFVFSIITDIQAQFINYLTEKNDKEN